MVAPIIYNIFPLLTQNMSEWISLAKHAKSMGFNSIYINPFQTPGLSGSIYSIKEYYKINPAFSESGSSPTGLENLESVLLEIRQLGMTVYMDLVINHTSIDCPLVKEHPEWYKRDSDGKLLHPFAIDPADARNITVWGDLYEIDNENSPDKANLFAFWEAMVESYVRLGISGFRCDAAYKVPAELWKKLIDKAALAAGEPVPFIAETLGCKEDEVADLANAGFNYIYNSSKWWNFDQPWALDQHKMFGEIAPSISFPESHDTPRLFAETNGNIQVQKQRYAFATVFSEGIQITQGYEYCWTKQCHVVKTTPADKESFETNIIDFINLCNSLKSNELFSKEGNFEPVTDYNSPTVTLKKTVDEKSMLIIINKDWHHPQFTEITNNIKLIRPFKNSVQPQEYKGSIELEPAEVIYALL